MFTMVTQRTPMDLFAADLDPVMLRDVPAAALPFIRKSTRYPPDERYESATEMLAAVEQAPASSPESPAPEGVTGADATQPEEATPEPVEVTAAPAAPGSGLRLVASPPPSGSVGDPLRFSARIPAGTIPEHRGYSVRMSTRAVGRSYRAIRMKPEGKVWRASVTVSPEMSEGQEWCMSAQPDPGALSEHPKLTAVACNAPRRVTIRAR
jgi:hypothetical protein